MPRRGLFTYENALVLILGLTFGVVFFDRQAASNLMPFIKPDLHMDNTQVGLIGSALSVTWALSAYLIGLLSDRTGQRKLILILCVLGFSVCSFISGLSHSFNVLAISRLVMGFLEGGVMPICLAIMAVESSERRRGLNAGIVQNGFSNLVGNSLGPIALIAIASAMSWRDAFYVAAIPGLLCAGAIWLWVKEPPKAPLPAGETAVKHPSLFDMLKVRNVLICSLISIFMVAWLITGFAFLPLVFGEMRHMTPKVVGYVMGALGMCAFLGGAMLPGLSDRIGRRPVMIMGCFAAIIAPMAALYVHGSVFLIGGLVFVGWIGNGIFPMFMGTIPGESLPRASIATAMGIVVGIGEILGGVCGPTFAGWLSDHTELGLKAPMFMMAACAFIAGCFALLLTETAPAKVGVSGGQAIPAKLAA